MTKVRAAALPLLCLFAACGSTPVGYLNTDVLEPYGMIKPTTDGPVDIQGTFFQKGTLMYAGRGDMQRIHADYIDAMRGQGWSPASVQGDSAKGFSSRLTKDTRMLTLTIAPDGNDVKVTIRVAPSK